MLIFSLNIVVYLKLKSNYCEEEKDQLYNILLYSKNYIYIYIYIKIYFIDYEIHYKIQKLLL